jgi:hypothetical protein
VRLISLPMSYATKKARRRGRALAFCRDVARLSRERGRPTTGADGTSHAAGRPRRGARPRPAAQPPRRGALAGNVQRHPVRATIPHHSRGRCVAATRRRSLQSWWPIRPGPCRAQLRPTRSTPSPLQPPSLEQTFALIDLPWIHHPPESMCINCCGGASGFYPRAVSDSEPLFRHARNLNADLQSRKRPDQRNQRHADDQNEDR